jgi:5'-AMP-activated protein kinase regulatory beta subunit
MARQHKAKQKVTFSYVAPEAHDVLVAGDFTDWEESPVSLKKGKNGAWTTTVSLPPGTYEYRLLVDGEWRDDPGCLQRNPNQFGSENCVCIVNSV